MCHMLKIAKYLLFPFRTVYFGGDPFPNRSVPCVTGLTFDGSHVDGMFFP